MSRTETILVLIIAFILIIWLSAMSFFIVSIYINSRRSFNGENNIKDDMQSNIDINSNFQTDFFNKSCGHAEKVLFGKVFIQEHGEPNYYGNSLMDVICKLNDETKKSIVTAIKYMSIEPQTARNNERACRIMAAQEKVPVWFVILRESTKKVVPDFIKNHAQDINSNVVPIYKTA